MCGIVGYTGPKQADNILIEGLEILEYRGYDSAGVAIIAGQDLKIVKKVGKVSELIAEMTQVDTSGNCGISHTRWATHGKPSDANSHPHTGVHDQFAVVHNGIIENYQELKSELLANGNVFSSETDTEVIAHLIEQAYDGDLFTAVREVVRKLEGAYALAVICTNEPDRIIAVRKETPLLIGLGDGEKILASDPSAIVKYTKKFWRLENGEMAIITPDTAEAFRIIDGVSIQKEVQEIDWNIEQAQHSGFDHYMRKEIAEQPEVIENSMRGRLKSDGQVVLPELSSVAEVLRKAQRFHLIACGTSYHAGLVGKYLLEQIVRVPVEADVASEYRYRNPLIGQEDVVVVISQSGETADTLAVVRLAKSKGVPVIGIVNVVNSSIAAECDAVVYLQAGPEIGVASTKAYVSQIVVLTLFTLYLQHLRGTESVDTARITRDLRKLSAYVASLILDDEKFEQVAMAIKDHENCFFIGRLVDYAVSMEGALKLKEISYIHAEAKAAGELKHGSLALIQEGTPVIALATQSSVREKMYSNIMEVKARGGEMIILTNHPEEFRNLSDTVITLPDVSPFLSPVLSVIPLQLLAYHAAVLRGNNPDRPRNLAKSVTVE